MTYTLPETNSSPLKIDHWKRRFLLETTIFGGYAPSQIVGFFGWEGRSCKIRIQPQILPPCWWFRNPANQLILRISSWFPIGFHENRITGGDLSPDFQKPTINKGSNMPSKGSNMPSPPPRDPTCPFVWQWSVLAAPPLAMIESMPLPGAPNTLTVERKNTVVVFEPGE